MPKESVLTIADKEAIKIVKIIFHIILKEDVKPHFLDELEITDEQKKFFKDRLGDSAQGRQYVFTDNNSFVKNAANEIFVDTDKFIDISKKLTNQFKITHTGNTNDGVFVIAYVTIRARKLLFLIKLDHKKVYQYRVLEHKALLKEVENTFVEDKSAVQKVALIDISDEVVWDVLVYDRSQPMGITDFFAKFLEVLPRETELKLTVRSISQVRKWASDNKDKLDPSQEPSHYKIRAVNYLRGTNAFDTNNFIDFVIFDEDQIRRDFLKASLQSRLEEVGLAGQTFSPHKDAFKDKNITNIRQTAEGVKIEWSGNPSDKNISIPNHPDPNDGNYHIEICTSSITEVQ